MSKVNLNEFEGRTPVADLRMLITDFVNDAYSPEDEAAWLRHLKTYDDLLDLLKDARRMVKELHAMLDEDDAYEWAVRNIGHEEMVWWNPEAHVGDEE